LNVDKNEETVKSLYFISYNMYYNSQVQKLYRAFMFRSKMVIIISDTGRPISTIRVPNFGIYFYKEG
jgi:hypothetical protein